MKQLVKERTYPLDLLRELISNSGAKEVMIISVFGLKTRKKQSLIAGIGDLVNVVVKKGKPDIR